MIRVTLNMPSAANHREMSGEFHIAWRVVTLKMQNTCCISNSLQKNVCNCSCLIHAVSFMYLKLATLLK